MSGGNSPDACSQLNACIQYNSYGLGALYYYRNGCSYSLLLKQTLGGEWSRPFCSGPRVGSSKGPKPVVMRGPERVLP